MKNYVSLLSVNQLAQKMPIRQILFSVLFLSFVFQGCTSAEDDASMESTEPVEAAPADTSSPDQPSESLKAEAPPPALEGPHSAAGVASKDAASDVAGAPMNTSRRVMYVKVDSAVLREQPEAKAKVVGTASRGDHFLVSVEGDWAKTEDGRYISTKVLSEKGVGRSKKTADWGQSQGSPDKPKKKRAKKAKSAVVPADQSATGQPTGEAAPSSGSESTPAADGTNGESNP